MTAAPMGEQTPSALDGVRVLDVAGHLGAYTARILGSLGADVIKIEPPGGDPSRRLAPFVDTADEPLSLPFVHQNINKRSIMLDLDRSEDQARFRALAELADVVVSTESAAAWGARELDLERLSTIYPALVWTAITPFGLTGPHRTYKGTNIVAEAMGGMMYIQGDDEKPPVVSPCEQAIHLANLHAASGALLALWERQTSGLGQLVDVSLQEVMAHVHFILVRYAYASEILRRPGVRNPQPPNGYFACTDGHVFISVFQPRQWERLAEWSGDPILLDPAFRDQEHRRAHPEVVNTCLRRFVASFDKWTFTLEAQRRGIPTAPLSTVADSAGNEHLAERRFFEDFEQPPSGRLRSAGPLFRATKSPYAFAGQRRAWASMRGTWPASGRPGGESVHRVPLAEADACRSRACAFWTSPGYGLVPLARAPSRTLGPTSLKWSRASTARYGGPTIRRTPRSTGTNARSRWTSRCQKDVNW